MDPLKLVILFVSVMLAGAINAIAGGGTVISYPGFLFAGLPDITANASNAMALVPGSLGSTAAYRRDLAPNLKVLAILLVPTFLGALLGALVVARSSNDTFRRIVPFCVLGATLLFAFRERVNRLVKRAATVAEAADHLTPGSYIGGSIAQFFIAMYGGYFGAGIGILMLTSLSVMGLRNIHRMNALKAALAAAINGTAVIFFAIDGKIDWPLALFAAVGALIGGYGLARLARRISPAIIRGFVVVFGLIASTYLFARGYGLI